MDINFTEIPRKDNGKNRQAERRTAYINKRKADRDFALNISKAWGRLTHPDQALFDYRNQIQKFADLYDFITTTRRRTFHRVKRHPER